MRDNWMRYAARALTMLWAGWWTLFGLLAGIGEGLDPVGVFMHVVVPGLVFLVAALIAWRWEPVGAALLVLEGLATPFWFWFARTPEGFLLLALPPLLAGGLFIADWLQSRRQVTAQPGA